MNKLVLICGMGALGACAFPEDGATGAGDPGEVTGTATAASFAYFPMGFARITAAGAIASGVAFDSAGGAVTPVRTSAGNYQVTFAGLAAPGLAAAAGGNVQVTAEGATNVRCRIINWLGLATPNLTATVQCTQPGGTAADSAFAILFFRYTMPAVNAFPTSAAYAWVQANGVVDPTYDYNSTGVHNTVTKTTGSYTVHIAGSAGNNASMMVTSYGGSAGGAVCSVSGWGGGSVGIECRNAANQLVDSAFSFSYAPTGPTLDQQGGHAWFDGGAAHPSYSAALGKIALCSPASVTGSRSGSLVSLTVAGDLGPWDATPFLRASMSSAYGAAGYCKVESLTASGAAPSSTATTTLRCYDPTGAVIAAPRLTFTHLTSDASGPC